MRGKTPPIRPLIGLGLLLLLGAGVRLLYLVYPIMDADQAINGLLARHILLGEFPIFFYGQEYCGTLENYLVAVVFLLFGANRFTLGLTIAVLSLFLVFYVYCFSARIADRRTALLAALLTACPSNYFAFTSVLARSAYIESPVLGVLLFIAAERLLRANPQRPALYLLLGFLAGLGLWTHFLFVFYLAPVGLLLLIKEKGFWQDPRVLLFLGSGLILGGLPLWMYNTVHPLATWHFLQANPIHEPFGESLKAFFSIRFPELLWLRGSLQKRYAFPYFSAAFYGVVLGGFLYLVYRRCQGLRGRIRGEGAGREGLDLLVVFVLLYPLIFSFSGFAANHTTRYLAPLYPAIPIFFSILFFHFKKRAPFIAWPFLALVLAVNVYGTSHLAVVFQPQQVQEYKKKNLIDQALFRFLKDNRIREVYVPDYWKAVPLTFIAQEEILFAQPYFDRYPPFTRLVDRSDRPAFLLLGDAAVFESTLQGIGGTYKKQRLGDQWLFYDFESPPFQFVEVPAAGQRAEPDGPGAPAAAALDGDLGTRWHLGRPMKPGDAFQLDLGATVPDIGRVFLLAGSPGGFPRGLRLDLSVDGRTWNTLRDIPMVWNSLLWSGPHPFIRPEKGATELTFPPQPGRYIRLTQTGSDPDSGWEIAELRVYRAVRSSPAPFPEIGSRLRESADRLRALKPRRVLASPWVRAQVDPHWSFWPGDPIEEGVTGRLSGPPALFSFPVLVAERGSSAYLREALEALAPGLYRQEPLGAVDLFSAPASFHNKRLSAFAWRVSASSNSPAAKRAIDGKMRTRWTSGAPQSPGLRFQIDLGHPERINRIRLLLGDSFRDFPRRLEIRCSLNGQDWKEVVPLNRSFYWDGERLFPDTHSAETDLIFPEVRTRFIVLEQTGKDPLYYWSIHELEIFSPGQP